MRQVSNPGRPARLASVFALAAGLAVAWLDTRSHWDDTGITAGCVFFSSAIAAGAGARPWLTILLTAGPIVVAEIAGGYGVLIAVGLAAVGAFVGWAVRRVLVH